MTSQWSWSQAEESFPPASRLPALPQGNSPVVAIAPAHVGASGDMLMASAILSNGAQQVILYDHSKETMAVYHIDSTSGDQQLKSVRKLDADFALQEFNLSEPTPSTIRKNVR